jgi:hypothetical protein
MQAAADGNTTVARKYFGREILFLQDAPLPFVGQASLSPDQSSAIHGAVMIKIIERMTELEREVRQLKKLASDKRPKV